LMINYAMNVPVHDVVENLRLSFAQMLHVYNNSFEINLELYLQSELITAQNSCIIGREDKILTYKLCLFAQ